MENKALQLSGMSAELRLVKTELEDVEQQISTLLERQQVLLSKKNELVKEIKSIESDFAGSAAGNSSTEQAVDWGSKDFSWTVKLDECLKSRFGIQDFRVYQRETINATMSGIDCILIMPTGGGKSLCFQLPALISKGFTLVISPLISLMEDQLLALLDLDINAVTLNASSSREHVNQVHSDMINKKVDNLKMLYVTPEKIAKSKRFMSKLEKAYEAGKLARIVIDEVHCTSQWGNDFRPDFKFLGILKRQFPTVPILGLTATATSKVINDVKKILNLQHGCIIFRASFNRPNLFYEVRTRSLSAEAQLDEIASTIKTEFKGQSGIVYCFSRKDTETVTVGLQNRGINAGCYHSDLDHDSRTYVHHSWTKNQIQVVVATVAFGMGIDKSNVRFVIHYAISKSMENFYQESGRAGRDDKMSKCILYYKFQDAFRQSSMVFTEQTGLDNLYGMLEYCLDLKTCRRKLIGKHFGEAWDPLDCNQMCDNCQRAQDNGILEKDITLHAKSVLKILQHAAKVRERITPLKIVEAWLGKGQLNLRVPGLQAPSLTAHTCERIVTQLVLKRIVKEDFHFTPYSTICYLVEGPRKNMVMTDQMKVFLDFDTTSSSSTKVAKRKSQVCGESVESPKMNRKKSVDKLGSQDETMNAATVTKRKSQVCDDSVQSPKWNRNKSVDILGDILGSQDEMVNAGTVTKRKEQCNSNADQSPNSIERKPKKSVDGKSLHKTSNSSTKEKDSKVKMKNTASATKRKSEVVGVSPKLNLKKSTDNQSSPKRPKVNIGLKVSNSKKKMTNAATVNDKPKNASIQDPIPLDNDNGNNTYIDDSSDEDDFEMFVTKSRKSPSINEPISIGSDDDNDDDAF